MKQGTILICDRCGTTNDAFLKDCKGWASMGFSNTQTYDFCPKCFDIFTKKFLNDYLRSKEEI